MARITNTKTHNIFLIDKSKMFQAKEITQKSIKDQIELLMSSEDEYKPQTLKENATKEGFSLSLYFRPEVNTHSKFSSFCKRFVNEDQDAVKFTPQSSSSVLFLWNKKHIYAVTTGQGFRVIEPYCLPKFGLIIASIFEERFKITSLDSNAISSIIHSTKTVYSNEVDFIDVNALDTVFKEITGRLKDATKVKDLLNLSEKSKKQSVKVTAKNYVQFSSALNIAGLIHLLSIIDGYDFEKYKDRFNLIVPLNTKRNNDIIEKNNSAVIEKLYAEIKAQKEISFDLFHEDTIDYISADSYVICNQETEEEYASYDDYADPLAISMAYHNYLQGNQDTLEAFGEFVRTVNIRSDKQDTRGITEATLLQHISGEIQMGEINYLIFYGNYYRLNASYTDRLNDSLRGKLRNGFNTSELKTVWSNAPGHDEDWFNKTVSIQEDYIHLHKVKPDYIEFADLMKVDNDTVTIIHVKDGFDCDMRALDRQVELSISKIIDVKHYNNDSYLRALYNNASIHTEGKNITTVFPTVEEFISCIKNKPVRYIIAIRPTNKSLINNKSNIAKHCLNALILRCFQQGIELKIQVL